MSDGTRVEEWYREVLREEFGRNAERVEGFLAAHRKRGIKPENPIREFNAVLAMIFHHGVLKYVRAALWQPLEDARARKGLKQQELAEELRLVPSTYAKIQAGATNIESILLFLRPLGLELRDIPLPPRSEQTAAGLLAVLPAVRYEVLGAERSRETDTGSLSRDDVEWLLHLDLSGQAWVAAFAGRDERAGVAVSACLAGNIGLRLGRKVEARTFADLAALWRRWVMAWEMCMAAVPTGRLG